MPEIKTYRVKAQLAQMKDGTVDCHLTNLKGDRYTLIDKIPETEIIEECFKTALKHIKNTAVMIDVHKVLINSTVTLQLIQENATVEHWSEIVNSGAYSIKITDYSVDVTDTADNHWYRIDPEFSVKQEIDAVGYYTTRQCNEQLPLYVETVYTRLNGYKKEYDEYEAKKLIEDQNKWMDEILMSINKIQKNVTKLKESGVNGERYESVMKALIDFKKEVL